MNEYPRLRARVDSLDQQADKQAMQISQLESMIVRLAEQINQMQQQRKPGRPKKEPNGTI